MRARLLAAPPLRARAMPYSAVVAGSTGAVGREVIAALLRSEDCTRITALIRAGSEARAQSRLVQHSKLSVAVLDWDALIASKGEDAGASALIAGHDLAVNAMGTTRKDAGGAAGFLRVDGPEGMCGCYARACKAAGTPSCCGGRPLTRPAAAPPACRRSCCTC